MLNHIEVMGRLTRDPELRKTPSDIPVAVFTLAVDRDFKGPNNERETDFIDIETWRSTAEFVNKYFTKGRMVFIMWITLIKRGIELLILRLGVPFAAVGLIDSDMGAFKGYMQIFLKAAFTTVIQVGLLSWAFRVAGTFEFANLMIAIAIISAAFATPLMMQQFLVATGGNGGVTQKVYSAGMAARAIRSLVR